MNKMAELKEKQEILSNKIKSLIAQDNFTKVAELMGGVNSILQTYTYMTGLARRVLGSIDGSSSTFDIIDLQDRSRLILDPEQEKFVIRYQIQPDLLDFIKNASVLQDWGVPYITRVRGDVVEGVASRIVSEELTKDAMSLSAYEYDIIEFFKQGLISQILEKEDRLFFSGLNGYIREAETRYGTGTSILAVPMATYDFTTIIEAMKNHIRPKRNGNPLDMFVMSEGTWYEIGKWPQTLMNNIARDVFDNGFGDKTSSKLYDKRVLRSDNLRWFHYETDSKDSAFGENIPSGSANDLYALAGYDTANLGNYLGGQIGTTYTKFVRIYLLSPRRFVGAFNLIGSDAKVHIKNDSGKIYLYADEVLGVILHNIFSVSVIDLWF